MKRKFLLGVALAVLPLLLLAQGRVMSPCGLRVLDEGLSVGCVTDLNAVGTGIVATAVGNQGVLTVAGGGGGASSLPHAPLAGRRWGFVQAVNPIAAPAFTLGSTVVGMPVPAAHVGTGSAQSDLTGTTRLYWQYASAATIDTLAGWSGAFNQTRPSHRPKLTGIIRTDTAIDTRRLWFGLAESDLTAVTHATGPTVLGNDFIGLGFDTSISANWRVCSGDNSNYTCADTGLAVSVSTEYTLTLDWSVAGTLTWKVNATSGTKTTNLSVGLVNIGLHNAITTLSAATRNHQFSVLVLEQN